jgi:hypothetical protein
MLLGAMSHGDAGKTDEVQENGQLQLCVMETVSIESGGEKTTLLGLIIIRSCTGGSVEQLAPIKIVTRSRIREAISLGILEFTYECSFDAWKEGSKVCHELNWHRPYRKTENVLFVSIGAFVYCA